MSARRASSGADVTAGTAGAEAPAVAAGAPSNAPVEGPKAPLTFEDVDKTPDARERTDKPSRVVDADWLNDAIGWPFYILNGGWNDWSLPNGRMFAVTRWYWHKAIAVDFPRNAAEVDDVPHKAARLKALGIAYVAIMPGESLSVDDVRARVKAGQAAIADLKAKASAPVEREPVPA